MQHSFRPLCRSKKTPGAVFLSSALGACCRNAPSCSILLAAIRPEQPLPLQLWHGGQWKFECAESIASKIRIGLAGILLTRFSGWRCILLLRQPSAQYRSVVCMTGSRVVHGLSTRTGALFLFLVFGLLLARGHSHADDDAAGTPPPPTRDSGDEGPPSGSSALSSSLLPDAASSDRKEDLRGRVLDDIFGSGDKRSIFSERILRHLDSLGSRTEGKPRLRPTQGGTQSSDLPADLRDQPFLSPPLPSFPPMDCRCGIEDGCCAGLDCLSCISGPLLWSFASGGIATCSCSSPADPAVNNAVGAAGEPSPSSSSDPSSAGPSGMLLEDASHPSSDDTPCRTPSTSTATADNTVPIPREESDAAHPELSAMAAAASAIPSLEQSSDRADYRGSSSLHCTTTEASNPCLFAAGATSAMTADTDEASALPVSSALPEDTMRLGRRNLFLRQTSSPDSDSGAEIPGPDAGPHVPETDRLLDEVGRLSPTGDAAVQLPDRDSPPLAGAEPVASSSVPDVQSSVTDTLTKGDRLDVTAPLGLFPSSVNAGTPQNDDGVPSIVPATEDSAQAPSSREAAISTGLAQNPSPLVEETQLAESDGTSSTASPKISSYPLPQSQLQPQTQPPTLTPLTTPSTPTTSAAASSSPAESPGETEAHSQHPRDTVHISAGDLVTGPYMGSTVQGDPSAEQDDGKSRLRTTPASGTQQLIASRPEQEEDRVRFNYASYLVGAKVVDSTTGSRGAHNVLNEDSDRYWRVPCRSTEQKWVVIELSEEILMDSFAIANFEYYSSTMDQVRLYGAVKYPPVDPVEKTLATATAGSDPGAAGAPVSSPGFHWMGTFLVNASHVVQVYRLPKPSWVRFVRLEYEAFHGRDYYCTLSLFRAFGSTIIEDLRRESQSSMHDLIGTFSALASGSVADDLRSLSLPPGGGSSSSSHVFEMPGGEDDPNVFRVMIQKIKRLEANQNVLHSLLEKFDEEQNELARAMLRLAEAYAEFQLEFERKQTERMERLDERIQGRFLFIANATAHIEDRLHRYATVLYLVELLSRKEVVIALLVLAITGSVAVFGGSLKATSASLLSPSQRMQFSRGAVPVDAAAAPPALSSAQPVATKRQETATTAAAAAAAEGTVIDSGLSPASVQSMPELRAGGSCLSPMFDPEISSLVLPLSPPTGHHIARAMASEALTPYHVPFDNEQFASTSAPTGRGSQSPSLSPSPSPRHVSTTAAVSFHEAPADSPVTRSPRPSSPHLFRSATIAIIPCLALSEPSVSLSSPSMDKE